MLEVSTALAVFEAMLGGWSEFDEAVLMECGNQEVRVGTVSHKAMNIYISVANVKLLKLITTSGFLNVPNGMQVIPINDEAEAVCSDEERASCSH